MLAGVAGCASCHTVEGGAPYAGGYAIETPWGTFHGSNLTPDPDHGLGAWSFDDFRGAMRHGRRPQGGPYYPAFPYPAFTGITDADLADLWAFLRTVEPVARPEEPHELHGLSGWRFLVRFWKLTGFDRGPYTPDRDLDPTQARGAYLGEAVGHCGECHTPRGGLGKPRRRHALEGSEAPPEPAPDITRAALSGWSTTELASFLRDGLSPDDDMVGGEMRRLVKQGTALLSDADRQALAAWVLAHEGQTR